MNLLSFSPSVMSMTLLNGNEIVIYSFPLEDSLNNHCSIVIYSYCHIFVFYLTDTEPLLTTGKLS